MGKIPKLSKKVSSPHSTGGSGISFEAKVLAYFITIMHTGGIVPVLNETPIQIISQALRRGYNTDDIVVIVENSFSQKKGKLICQAKQSIAVTKSNTDFSDFIRSAWLDYNDSQEYNKDNDAIILITGPLSKTDINGVLPLLDYAKLTKDTNGFMIDLNKGGFISDDVREKYEVICYHLTCANNSENLSDEEIHDFLRNIHILQFDLGGIHGINLSLICSHLSQCCHEPPKQVWDSLLNYATTCMNNGSSIKSEDLPDDIRCRFSKITSIPIELHRDQEEDKQFSGNIPVLTIMSLIGSWDSRNEGDVEAVSKFVKETYTGGYAVWFDEIKKILIQKNSPISFNDGIWKLNDRKLSKILTNNIFDETLKAFSEFVLKIVKERDPALDLSPDKRFAATVYGKNRKYSKTLRRSVSDGLAILANNKDMLSNCSESGKKFLGNIVHSIMDSITWEGICSLNGLMQPIAEASPEIFLNCLETSIQNSPDIIMHVKEQENSGLFGQYYVQDIIWALEALAWNPEYLSDASSLLAMIAKYYEESNKSAPLRSLTEIFLPWNPHTTANVTKRINVVKILCEEKPNVAWPLLLNLLPDNYSTSSGTIRPIWMKIDVIQNEGKIKVSDYWDEIDQYSALAVDVGRKDPAKIPVLIEQMNNMPQNAFDNLIEIISSLDMDLLTDSTKTAIVNSLHSISSKNKKYFDAEWTLTPENLKKLDDIVLKIESNDPYLTYVNLFSLNDYNLYKSKDYEKERERIEHQRIDAVKIIINKEGIEGIIKFSNIVGRPDILGYALGLVDEEYYEYILPSKMSSCNHDFIKGYILGRFRKKNWDWSVFSDIDSWNSENKVHFLYLLPFTPNILSYVRILKEEDAISYWKNVVITPFELNQDTYEYFITSLLNVGRFYTSVYILSTLLGMEKDNDLKVDSNLIVKVLLFNIEDIKDTQSGTSSFDTCDLIKRVQVDTKINVEDRILIEWKYLNLMGNDPNDIRPITLEKQMSQDPEFFCYIIGLIYKSEKDKDKSLSEERAFLAVHAYKLVELWKMPPGMDDNGNFDIDKFKSWLQAVGEISNKTGHTDVSMSTLGNVLTHVPPDKDGLWINNEVAKILNDEKSEEMRRGLYLGYVNSVGVYTPGTGLEDRMAETYRKRAESAEEHGYRRLANSMKDVQENFISLKEHNKLHDF